MFGKELTSSGSVGAAQNSSSRHLSALRSVMTVMTEATKSGVVCLFDALIRNCHLVPYCPQAYDVLES